MTTRVIPREQLPEIVDELSTLTLTMPLVVPDGAGGERAPLLGEISSLELTVYLDTVEGGTDVPVYVYGGGTWSPGIETLTNVNIRNTGRGVYDQATGLLTVTLHAGDNPFLTTSARINAREQHVALIACRYNGDADAFSKEIVFAVRNLNRAPRVP